eukprot:scaffold1450_cov170-Amphora_coffeaeformis.AAC.5
MQLSLLLKRTRCLSKSGHTQFISLSNHSAAVVVVAIHAFACCYHIRSALEQVERAIKQEFEEAREIIPDIVATETKFIDFLRCESMDPVKAAVRLSMYWKGRKILFSERWLLPMNQTGTGALSMKDIEVLRAGSHVIFNRPGQGFFSVVDESRLQRPTGNTIFRIIYYMCIPFCDEETQRQGTTVLHVVNSKPRPDPNLDRIMYDLVRAGIPMKLRAFHVVQAYEEGKNECLDFLGYKETSVTGFRLRIYPDRIASDSMIGTLRMLESMGFKREHLPRCLGGDYDHKQYDEWVRTRISIEDMMSSIPLTANRLSLTTPGYRIDAPVRRRRNSGSTNATSSSVDENDRQRNALKSRRSYHRTRLVQFSLREHQRVWEMRNAPLREETVRLESLLAQAHECLVVHLGENDAKEEASLIIPRPDKTSGNK